MGLFKPMVTGFLHHIQGNGGAISVAVLLIRQNGSSDEYNNVAYDLRQKRCKCY